jgi:hypothetical protein
MANAIMGEAIAHAVSKGENRIRKYALDAGEPIAIVSPTPIVKSIRIAASPAVDERHPRASH